VGAERGFQRRAVADVAFDEIEGFAGDLLHPLLHRPAGVGQVVDHDHVVARILQLDDGVGTDIAHAASNQNLHCVFFLDVDLPSPCRFRRRLLLSAVSCTAIPVLLFLLLQKPCA
jgi:hypothetical protein